MNEENTNYEVYENKKNQEKLHKRKVKSLIFKMTFMAMLLIVSTYAWFTSQKDITLSNIRGTVEVVENMEISLDAKTWHQKIDLSNAAVTFGEAQTSRDAALGETDTKSTALAIVPEQLFPVSGVTKTGVTLLPLYEGEATSTSLTGIGVCAEEEIKDGKDVAKDNGYIAFDMYIKNTSRDNEIDVLQLNINSSAQVLTETISKEITDIVGNRVNRTYNGNEASGLQNTIRVALAKYGNEVSSTSTQLEILNSTKGANIADVAIWEPNAYDHVETIVSNNNKLINGSNTEKIEFTAYHPNTPLETYALNGNATELENVYDISSTGVEAQNTFKTDNLKDADNKIKSYRIKTENNKPLNIKNTSNNNFEIASNAVTRYRVYVWLEGQDVDCINIASLGGGIELDLGLTKDDEVGDVLSEIDDRVSYTVDADNVTATITMDKVITPLPSGWTYTDATQKVIEKEYNSNKIEQVEVKTEDGKISKIEVNISNIETKIENITNDNIGNYIDLGNNIIGTNATTDDWRILYAEDTNSDGKTDKVYVILANYLPSSKVPTGIGLSVDETNYPYIVRSSTPIDWSGNQIIAPDLAAALIHDTAWDSLANGKSEEVVAGPTEEVLLNSYNTVNGTNLSADEVAVMDSPKYSELYMPNTTYDIWAYWTTPLEERFGNIILGYTVDNTVLYNNLGVRPMITLTTGQFKISE